MGEHFTQEAQDIARDILGGNVPDFVTVFKILQDPVERQHLGDVHLITTAYCARADLRELAQFARDHRGDELVKPIIQWCALITGLKNKDGEDIWGSDESRRIRDANDFEGLVTIASNWVKENDPDVKQQD